MSSQTKCPDCGSSEIIDDSHYSQNQLVCADCGFILTEGLLTTTFADEEHLQEVTYSRSTGQKDQQSRCLLRGIKRVQDLCKVLVLPPLFEDTAVSYYHQAIKRPCFRLVALGRKEIIVGCCVFVTCRQHNWPLTMGTVCMLLYADKELFTATYLRFLRELAINVPALSLTNLVKTHVSSFVVCQKSPNIPPKFVEDKEQLVARTVQLVELASETWLVTGRHPVPVVVAAAYLAWQSLRPVDRLASTLAHFCKLCGTDLPGPTRLRLKELHNILLQMSTQLSWLRVLRVSRKTVAKYVGDLLQHRHFLLRAAFCATDSTEDSGGAATSSAAEALAPQQPAGESSVAPEAASHTEEEPRRGSKRAPLLPPCALKPAKKPRQPEPNPADLGVSGDEPISDSEIDEYLRSPEEKEVFCKAQACL